MSSETKEGEQRVYHGGLDGQPPFRVLPRVSDEEREFWSAGERGELVIQYCSDCSRYHHPPLPICPGCTSNNVAPRPVSGRGTVYTYTVNVQPWNPTFEHPYVIAVIELEEQANLRLVSNVYGCAPGEVEIGTAVEAFFEPFEDVWLPLFRVREGAR